MKESGLAIILFGAAAIFSIAYGIYQHVSIALNKSKIAYTKAVVIEAVSVVPEGMVKNSRRVRVRFWVYGREYISSQQLRVAMNISVGDEIEIAYFKDNPSEIFTGSWKKETVAMFIGAVCLMIMTYLMGRG